MLSFRNSGGFKYFLTNLKLMKVDDLKVDDLKFVILFYRKSKGIWSKLDIVQPINDLMIIITLMRHTVELECP